MFGVFLSTKLMRFVWLCCLSNQIVWVLRRYVEHNTVMTVNKDEYNG